MTVRICLEVGPKATGAFVPDCPGCWVFSGSQELALKKVGAAVSEWYTWLKDQGETVVAPHKIRIEPKEILSVDYNPAKAGKPEPLFWSEVLPVSSADIESTLRLLDYSRKDLLKLSSGLDRSALRWKPKGGPRTVSNCLRHIALVEWWYISRLDIDLPTDFPKDTVELLHYTRGLAKRNLRSLPKEKRGLIFQPQKDPSPVCNLWTARKVLRRFVDHERLHTKYIKRALDEYHRHL